MNRLVLPDLKLTPVPDEVPGKQPLWSLGPLIPTAGKKQTELVRRRGQFSRPQPMAVGSRVGT